MTVSPGLRVVVDVEQVRGRRVLGVDETTEDCHTKLAAYKVPRLVEFRDQLPKTNMGKVLRRALK